MMSQLTIGGENTVNSVLKRHLDTTCRGLNHKLFAVWSYAVFTIKYRIPRGGQCRK